MTRPLELTGQRFDRLVAQAPLSSSNARGAISWLCRCDCGQTTNVLGSKLKEGRVRSCGCLKAELVIEQGRNLNRSHGLSQTAEYTAWLNMKDRCSNPSNIGYLNYGGRGITVDPKWMNSFEEFISDMGPRPSDDHSLDRIDVNGNYGPGNCRWATRLEQQSNKRTNVFLEYQGKRYTLTQLCALTGVNVKTFQYRINQGKSIEEALKC